MAIFRREQGVFHPRRLREWVAPRKGWDRGIRYVRARLQRLPGSPHSIALGFAFGTLTSFSPFFGFHILLAILLAWALRVSLVAAALGTAVGNPITFPFIIASAVETGRRILGQPPLKSSGIAEYSRLIVDPAKMLAQWPELLDRVLLPYAVGGLALGIPAAAAGYLLVRSAVAAFRLARRRLAAKRFGRKRAVGAPPVPVETASVRDTIRS